MLKGFRASISHDVSYGHQPLPHQTYVKVPFGVCLNDTTGRYDTSNCRWTPVPIGGQAQYVMVGAKLGIAGGVSPYNPIFNCKIMRNGSHSESDMPLSGTNGPNSGLPGTGEGQANLGILANPGDFFEVWAMVSASPTLQPPAFYSWFGAGTTMIDPHYGHTGFWGLMLDLAALTALQALMATQGTRLDDIDTLLAAHGGSIADLQSRVTALECA